MSARSGWRVNPGALVRDRFRAVPRTDTPRRRPDDAHTAGATATPHPQPQAAAGMQTGTRTRTRTRTEHPTAAPHHRGTTPGPGPHKTAANDGARPREPGAGPFRPRGGTAMQHREELDQPKRPEM
ncbi:hypothetical protein GCM10010254_68560 [Streptomyces chromofuscus]|nr:hypothetical protein GCM10010254_68560 [Streptomyces chromofuscus]